LREHNDGTFILMKTISGTKPVVKLFKLPVNANLDNQEEDDY
jgi:hypothetical protein